jgi:site-specific DNA-methyltransferase (adenine-specific)
LAGSAIGDYVIDPFFGSGTTGLVASIHKRNFIGVELKTDYIELAESRLKKQGVTFDVIYLMERSKQFV